MRVFYITVIALFGAVLAACSSSSNVEESLKHLAKDLDLSALLDTHVKTGSTITFDATQVNCPSGSTVIYSWELVNRPAGSSAGLDDTSSPIPSITLDVEGDYLARASVDCGSKTIQADFSATVSDNPTNAQAVAIAGLTQTAKVGRALTLDGRKSFDTDGNPLTFTWTVSKAPSGSAATLSDSDSAEPVFVPDVMGEYEFTLVVHDGSIDSTPDRTYVYATNTGVNAQPVANAGLDQTELAGHVVTLHSSGSYDPDLDSLTYEWELNHEPAGSGLAGTLAASGFDATSADPVFTPTTEGKYVFRLRVIDGSLTSAWDYITVSVTGASHSGSDLSRLRAMGLDGADAQYLIDNHPSDVSYVLGLADPIFAGVTITDSMFKSTADSGAALFESTVKAKMVDWEERHKTRFKKIFGRIAFTLNTQRFANAFDAQAATLLDPAYQGSMPVDPSANISNYTSNITASTEFPSSFAQFKADVNAIVNEVAQTKSFRFYLSPTSAGTAYGGRDLRLMIEQYGMAGDSLPGGGTKKWLINGAAGLMFHELMHSVGYAHDPSGAPTELKPNNIPYFVQIIVSYQETDILNQYCGGSVATCTKSFYAGTPNSLYTYYFGNN